MGDKVWDWFLPIRGSQGDGIRFEYNEKLARKLRNKAKAVVRHQVVAEFAKRAEQGAAGDDGGNAGGDGGEDTNVEKEESTITV
jgi:hypothetical protein